MEGLPREVTVVSVVVGEGEASEYEVPGEDGEDMIAALYGQFYRSRESSLTITVIRKKVKGAMNGH
jgi:hypothetical protein